MAHVLGEGQAKLELFLVNFLVLDEVYHIYDIRKNLINTFFVSPTRVQGCF